MGQADVYKEHARRCALLASQTRDRAKRAHFERLENKFWELVELDHWLDGLISPFAAGLYRAPLRPTAQAQPHPVPALTFAELPHPVILESQLPEARAE